MIRIGIVGEHFKNDALPLKVLLDKKFNEKATILPILKNTGGTKILNQRAARLINDEAKRKNLKLVILAKDLDGLPSETKKINEVIQKSNKLKQKIKIAYLLFLVIFELEALILADIDTFNKKYKTNYKLKTSPKFQSEPKELLKKITRNSKKKYKESDTPEIFQQLNFQKVYQNHKGEYSFQSFIDELEITLN